MYYNLSEEEQFYIATTHAMLKGGYTHEEIDKFWQCEDSEEIVETFKTLEFSSRVSMRDPDLLEYFYGDGKDLQENIKRRAREAKAARPLVRRVMGALYDAEDIVRGTVRGVRNWNNPKQSDIDRIRTLNRYLSNPSTTGVGRTKRTAELRSILTRNRNNVTKADIPDLEDIARRHFPDNSSTPGRIGLTQDPKLTSTSGSGGTGNYAYKPDPSKPNTGTNAAQAQRTGQATADALPKTAPATSAASGTPTPPKTGGINFPVTAAAGGALVYGANELRKGEKPETLTPAQRNDLAMDDADKTIEKSGRTEKDFCPPGTSIERTRIPGTNQSNVRCKTSGGVDVGDLKNKTVNKTGQGGSSTTPPPGAFNISPKGSPRRTELEAQIKRDNAARKLQQQATDPNKRADQNNFDSAGQEIKIGDTVGGSDMQPPTVKQPPAQQQPPSTQQQPSTQQPSTTKTKKRRYRNIHPEEYAYEFILDRLISEGHASSLAEAEYVFKQLDNEYIESMLNE